MKNSDQPIWPVPYVNRDGTISHDAYFGLTKREYFAAMAMQGMAASAFWDQNFQDNESFLKQAMEIAVKSADALLNQLSTKKP